MKKLVSGILALGLAVTTVVSAVASAAGSFINGKDPNGDGYLSLADSTYIQLVLSGKYRPSDLTQLDVDDNCVVSNADVYMTQLAELGYYNNVSETEDVNLPMNVVAGSTSRSYNVYNAKTGTYKRTYSLSVEDDDNAAETYGMIPPTDDRVEDWSNRGVAKIMMNNEVGYNGTGFVVGRHTIATAAHVVFDTVPNTAYQLTDILLFDGDETPHSFTPVEVHVPQTHINFTAYFRTCDYALITVKEDLRDYMSFGLGMMTTDAYENQIQISCVGFPRYFYSENLTKMDEINNGTLHSERLTTGAVTEFISYDDSFQYIADSSSGNSGGPIYVTEVVDDKVYNTIIGISVSGPTRQPYNCGLSITPEILKFYNVNSNIQY